MLIQCPQCSSRYNASMKTAGDIIHCNCGVDFHVPTLPNLARSWKCPNCAVAVDPNKSQCEYCNAYLAFARCPSCFSISPYESAKYCAECGESLTLPIKVLRKSNQSVPCPRCQNALSKKIIDNYVVDLCKKCDGVWLEHKQLNEIMEEEPLNSIAVLGVNPSSVDPKKLPRHDVKYLACPECNDIMGRYNFMRDSNIILDQCHKHGVWFDKYELAAALEYIRSSLKRPSNLEKSSQTSLEDKSTNRKENEHFEITDEDLQLLLEEFPEWAIDKKA